MPNSIMSIKSVYKIPSNHRTMVGLSRRSKMRNHLLKSALDLYIHQSTTEVMIDDLIRHANVARGTFYNYFKTTHELNIALTGEMSDEILNIIDPYLLHYSNSLERMSMGLRLYIFATCKYPIWGKLLTNMGPHHTVRDRKIDEYVSRDLNLAMQQNLIPKDNVQVLKDLILGAVYYAIESIQHNQTADDYVSQVLEKLMIIIGLELFTAHRLSYQALEKIDKVESHFFSSFKQNE